MPLQKLTFRSGLNREGTDYSNEGGWYDGDKIRFRSGFPEKLGGWTRLSNNTFLGAARSLWSWVDLAGSLYIGVGTNVKYYVEWSDGYYDITPYYYTHTVTNPFTTTYPANNTIVTVTDTGYLPNVGDYVVFSGSSAVGGILASTLNQEFLITSTNAATNSYTIQVPAGLGATSAAGPAGGTVTVNYEVPTGLNTYIASTGWGSSPWGYGGWGLAYAGTIGYQLRLWTADNFGEYLILAPRGGPIYLWQSTGTYTNSVSAGLSTRAQSLQALSTAAGYSGTYVPNSTYQVITSAIQKFVIAFGANSYVSGSPSTTFNPMLVRWSDQINPYQWVPDVTNQSGEFPLTVGSYIMGARATRQEILIWTDSAIYSMQYLGAPYVWSFQILMENISIMSPNAMVTVNNVTYWMGVEKFYMYSGTVQTLPCSLRQYIFDDINQAQAYQVFAGANEGFNEVWWFYCSNDSNVIDKYIIYNYLDQVWYYGTMSRTAWYDTGIIPEPVAANYISASSFIGSISGTTLTVTNMISGVISLDTTITGTGVTSSTTITDSITGTGGVGTYTVNTSQTVSSTTITTAGDYGLLLYHENGVDDVAGPQARAIDSYVQSSDFDIEDGHNFGFVWRILPDVNFNGSNVNNPYVTMTIKPRVNSGTPYGIADNPTVTSSDNFTKKGTYNIQQFTGQVYTRLRGRQLSFRIESNSLGVAWQLGVPRIDIRKDGRR
jgi:hypothetical protein